MTATTGGGRGGGDWLSWVDPGISGLPGSVVPLTCDSFAAAWDWSRGIL
jgi:hypothetical protein